MLRNSIKEHSLLILLIISMTNVSILVDAYVQENSLQSDQDNRVVHYLKSRQNGIRHLFEYSRNGIKMDVKLVPLEKNPNNMTDDRFPEFPKEAIGHCIYELSLGCIQKRLGKYIQDIASLDQILLFGNNVKLVKTKVIKSHRRSIKYDQKDEDEDIVDRSIDDFFDTFVLRITLPNWNGKAVNNQIDLMFDNTDVVEGRGKGGGGGGGKGCKKMMMMAMGMMKMKFMGMMSLAAMKGMMMAGMSLMISKAMLMMKLMSLKGGGGGGGGHGGGGGGGVWKSGGGGGGRPSDSYGAPPPSPSTSYGAPPSTGYGVPSGGGGGGGGGYDYSGGGGGGGGGWGRSFDDRISMMNYKSDESNMDDPTSEFQPLHYDSNNAMFDPAIDENSSHHFDIGSVSSTNLNSKNDIIEIQRPVHNQSSVYKSRRFLTAQPLIPIDSISPVNISRGIDASSKS